MVAMSSHRTETLGRRDRLLRKQVPRQLFRVIPIVLNPIPPPFGWLVIIYAYVRPTAPATVADMLPRLWRWLRLLPVRPPPMRAAAPNVALAMTPRHHRTHDDLAGTGTRGPCSPLNSGRPS